MTPAVRFKGFTDPWEQRKFSEVFSFLRNNTLSRAELSDSEGETRDVHYGDILVRFGEVIDVRRDELPRIASDALAGGLSCQPLSNGDVIIADTAEDEAVGKCSELRGCGDYPIVSGLHTMACRPEFEFAPGYLGYYMNSPAFHDQLLPLMQGIKVISVSKGAISDTEVCFPSLPEQKAIGASLTELDNLITLHQRTYDQLAVLKKALLDKMFPRDGAFVPEIRFVGFTDPWEQRKLGELATKVTQKNGDMAVMETFTNSAEFGVVSQLDFFDHDIAKEESIGGYFVVQPEDFVYNPRISVTAPVGPINRNRLGRAGVMSPLYTVFRPGDAIDNAYLEHYFETSGWHDFMQLNGNSGARSDRFSISDSVFFEMPIPYPSMKEQVSIANALESLDNLITLHLREPPAWLTL